MVVLVYKVAVNTELASTYFVPRGDTGLGSYEPLGTTFLLIDQYITLFYESCCLKTPYVINIVNSLSMNTEPTAL